MFKNIGTNSINDLQNNVCWHIWFQFFTVAENVSSRLVRTKYMETEKCSLSGTFKVIIYFFFYRTALISMIRWIDLILFVCRYLYTVLSKNQNISESNRSLLVETLRSIAEILIWGDQNDSSVFEWVLQCIERKFSRVTKPILLRISFPSRDILKFDCGAQNLSFIIQKTED